MPEGLLKRANQAKILPSVLFFYQLKAMNTNGVFIRNGLLKNLGQFLKITPSAVFKRLEELIRLQLIRKTEQRYILCSYDTLFKLLKYDLDYNFKANRYGKFKIFKLSIVEDFMLLFSYCEIAFNFSKQRYFNKKNPNTAKNKLVRLKTYISTRGISRILGFSSSSMGFKILSKLTILNWVSYISSHDEDGFNQVNDISLLYPLKKLNFLLRAPMVSLKALTPLKVGRE